MKIISPLLVIFCCLLAVKSETCLGSHEKSIISGIKSAIKTLEEKLEGNKPFNLYTALSDHRCNTYGQT